MTTIETPEAAFAQKQIEHFARLAHRMASVVEELGNAFCDLDDYPANLGEAMPQLRAFADLTARIAVDWARIGDASFRSSPWD
jgi:hypothetical protein